MWDEITYPFPCINGATVEVWEWIKKFHTTFYWICDYLSMVRLKGIHVNKRGPWCWKLSMKQSSAPTNDDGEVSVTNFCLTHWPLGDLKEILAFKSIATLPRGQWVNKIWIKITWRLPGHQTRNQATRKQVTWLHKNKWNASCCKIHWIHNVPLLKSYCTFTSCHLMSKLIQAEWHILHQ